MDKKKKYIPKKKTGVNGNKQAAVGKDMGLTFGGWGWGGA